MANSTVLANGVTTTRFALDRAEVVTTSVAAVVSTSAYLHYGHPYLARGVVGDLLGFGALAVVALRTRRRLRHEAALCLTVIAAVIVVHPQWPLLGSDPLWWLLFALGLLPYIALRRHVCD